LGLTKRIDFGQRSRIKRHAIFHFAQMPGGPSLEAWCEMIETPGLAQ
jgi:hypothetical protein